MRPTHVKLFIEHSGALASVYAYRDYVNKRPGIEVVSVDIFGHNYVALTYK